jgi:nucleoside-diphosphate-sugar epimerase
MPSSLVLITGATGHLGYRTLIETLKAGYHVRAAVRNEAGIKKIRAAESTQPYLNHIEFVFVPDMEKEDAYNEAVKGVKNIIHLASPIPHHVPVSDSAEMEALIVQPAIRGTLNMLRAAKAHSPTTERIVITTSILALISWADFFGQSGKVFNETSRTLVVSGSYENGLQAYAAGKVAALKVTEEFVVIEQPHFTVNNVAPSAVIGKNEIATTAADSISGTNSIALGHVLGLSQGPTPSAVVYLDDIARTHILALSPSVPGNQVFIGVSDNSNNRWEDAFDVVKQNFPQAVTDGTFPLTGSNPTIRLIIDNSWTRKTLHQEFLPYAEQVRSVAQHYLDLKGTA